MSNLSRVHDLIAEYDEIGSFEREHWFRDGWDFFTRKGFREEYQDGRRSFYTFARKSPTAFVLIPAEVLWRENEGGEFLHFYAWEKTGKYSRSEEAFWQSKIGLDPYFPLSYLNTEFLVARQQPKSKRQTDASQFIQSINDSIIDRGYGADACFLMPPFHKMFWNKLRLK